MAKIKFEKRLNVLIKLGEYLRVGKDDFKDILTAANGENNWFNPANSWAALENIANNWLQESALHQFISAYPACQDDSLELAHVGMVMAGNVPLVGFHDVLCGWLAGAKVSVKLSDKDKVLMTVLINFMRQLCTEEEREYLQIVDKLSNYDRVIATGSNNSGVYFEQYFGHVPHLIRKNRNSVAILNGKESEADIMNLGLDIFRYFGLGCRSVAKVYLPQGYDISFLLGVLDNYKDICNHTKYANNFDYNRSVFLLNREVHYINDCMILLENNSFTSRISTLNYEFYTDMEVLSASLQKNIQLLQCIAANFEIKGIATVKLGNTQKTNLDDFADNVDTMLFLLA